MLGGICISVAGFVVIMNFVGDPIEGLCNERSVLSLIIVGSCSICVLRCDAVQSCERRFSGDVPFFL
jgi:hypothetical protein